MDSIAETIKTIQLMVEHSTIKNKLTSLTVHSMRRFMSETTVNFLFPITVLVGKNSSGKTTLMKMIQVLSDCTHPETIFFETAIDDGGMENAHFSYNFGDDNVDCKRIASNKWCIDGQIPNTLKIVYLNPKTLVGAFEKSFLYDDVGKSPKLKQKVEYVVRQAKKVLQNNLKESGKKKEWSLSPNTITMVNEILQLHFDDVRIVKHKYFSGTWATNVFFSDGVHYSEYNAGSGEFLIAIMLDQIFRLPDDTLLLLDEPEISLHPGAQKRFMQCLLEIAKKKKLQVIMTTHSASIIEYLPPAAIVGLKRVEQLITAEGNLNFKYAFTEIEENITKNHIIVEDSMAKDILDGVIREETLEEFIQVDYFPGGADNLKTHTIFTYAKTHVDNRFIIFDGDQRPPEDIPDFSTVLEKDKTLEYYNSVFKRIVRVNPDSIVWGVDANKKAGRKNEEQERQLLIDYLEFFRNNVTFLPALTPEDIIYDAGKLEALCGDLPRFEEKADSKAKIKAVSDATGYGYGTLISVLTTAFLKKKNENYNTIAAMLRNIVET